MNTGSGIFNNALEVEETILRIGKIDKEEIEDGNYKDNNGERGPEFPLLLGSGFSEPALKETEGLFIAVHGLGPELAAAAVVHVLADPFVHCFGHNKTLLT